MIPLVDTHAHLTDGAFSEDLPEVVDRARSVGVAAVVVVTETAEEIRHVLELSERFPDWVRPAAGLFPTVLDIDEAQRVRRLIRENRDDLFAVGEVGLDLWKVQDPDEREQQREIFARFVELAMEVDLPLNVHSRSAGRQTIELLLQMGASRVQMHAFDGRASKALPGAEAGFYFSVPPSIVRSAQKQKLVRRLPLENLLVETDSPVLGADPGVRNEPAEVIRSIRAIAELKNVSQQEVCEVTSRNAVRLYGEGILERSLVVGP